MVNAVKVFTLRLCISAYYIHFKRVKVKIFTAFTINSTKDNTDVDKDNWIRCEITEAHPYGIKQYKKDEDGEIDSLTKLTDDIMYTADYDFLGAITDEEVRNRIIVVGSSTNSNTRADHSVNGQRVDIYAPRRKPNGIIDRKKWRRNILCHTYCFGSGCAYVGNQSFAQC